MPPIVALLGAVALVLGLAFGFWVPGRRQDASENDEESGEFPGEEASGLRLLKWMLLDASRRRVSRIVIDRDRSDTWVTFEVEGEPLVAIRPGKRLHSELIGELAIMAGFGADDIAGQVTRSIRVMATDQEAVFDVHMIRGPAGFPSAVLERR